MLWYDEPMKTINNKELSEMLSNVAAAYAIKDQKKFYFQMLAYQKAADNISEMSTQVYDLWKDGKLDQVQGIGQTMQKHLDELFKSGKSKHFESITSSIPSSVFVLLKIPSFGPKKAYKLVSTFKLLNGKTVIEDLKKIAKNNQISKLEGFGEKSQADILRALNEYQIGAGKTTRMTIVYANEVAEKILEYLKKS